MKSSLTKKLQAIVSILLLASMTGCCLLVAAGLGIGGYFLVNKYGQLLYFADFWASEGSNSISVFISDQIKKVKADPSLLPAKDSDGRYLFEGPCDFDKEPLGPVQGKYALYSSKGEPLSYKLYLTEKSENKIGFDTFILSGKIIVEDHKIEGTIVTQPQFILFDETIIGDDGAVTGGKVSVGDRDLDVSKYSDLIERFMKAK